MAVGSRVTPRLLNPWVGEGPCWNIRVKSYLADILGVKCWEPWRRDIGRQRLRAEGRAGQVGVWVLSLSGRAVLLGGWKDGRQGEGRRGVADDRQEPSGALTVKIQAHKPGVFAQCWTLLAMNQQQRPTGPGSP